MSEGWVNPGMDEICALLRRVRQIAVVGLSPRPNRPSHGVAKALQGFGYRVLPVNPHATVVHGEPARASLDRVPERIDLVDVFRAPRHVPAIVEQCIALGVPALWLQDGVVDLDAARRARDAGITVVMDRCIYRDYRRCMG